MRKILATTFALSILSCSAFASSTINLLLPANNVMQAGSSADIDLDGLTAKVPYNVTCELDSASSANLDMSFTSELAAMGGFGVPVLNGNAVTATVMGLKPGVNNFSFMASVAENKKGSNLLQLKNLDDEYSVTVKSCKAVPASGVVSANNFANLTTTTSGTFSITNKLGYFLDVAVGNYMPTSVCIPPYHLQYVSVSTDNQNVQITNIHN